MNMKRRSADFYDTEEGKDIVDKLRSMQGNDMFNTEPSYTANIDDHPSNKKSFVDKHKQYIMEHPKVDPEQYLANLRLKTRLRR